MPTGKLDLEHTAWQGWTDFRLGGMLHNLNRQEARHIHSRCRGAWRASRNHLKIMLAFSAYRRATCATETSGAVV